MNTFSWKQEKGNVWFIIMGAVVGFLLCMFVVYAVAGANGDPNKERKNW